MSIVKQLPVQLHSLPHKSSKKTQLSSNSHSLMREDLTIEQIYVAHNMSRVKKIASFRHIQNYARGLNVTF